jgi:pyruvate-ferredoxin/flavodoxin oxidoreductase
MISSGLPYSNAWITDGNGAAVDAAYRLSDLCALYPITPSSAMGEAADEWSTAGRTNLWGGIPEVVEMQSEAGAAGALHGALQAGSLATTFTSSQGLLLMLPSMFKIAGELSPCVIHVAARSIATHALSIFGDHSDVMTARTTGWAMLCATNVQEAHDFACISHIASLHARIPFLHFFDGFRTSHEMKGIHRLSDQDLRALFPETELDRHRERALNPDRPVIRGTSQNPDVFFQGRERANTFYDALPDVVQTTMDAFTAQTGRAYRIMEYSGDPEAETVLVLMGSGAETAQETVSALHRQGRNVGVITIRLYRPWPADAFLQALPESVKRIAVLDRTKEPGSSGEPLFLDVAATLQQSGRPIEVRGGRYGLGSKEFTPAMVVAILDDLEKPDGKKTFTVGIHDDITHLSLPVDSSFTIEDPNTTRALFYGLGSDGTVSANKNTLHILGSMPGRFAQGYFVYDSNKSGSRTVSHLRFGPHPIHAPYLIESANFIACHAFSFVHQLNLLEKAEPGATFLLNSPHGPDTVLNHLPSAYCEQLQQKNLKFFVINASKVARESGLGGHINTVMQTCFFALSGVLPQEEALAAIRQRITSTYGRKGSNILGKNLKAVDATLEELVAVAIPETLPESPARTSHIPEGIPDLIAKLLNEQGNDLPVSAMPVDGTWPVGTAKWNQRDLSPNAPVWDPDLCIQCGHCVTICPHGVIRVKQAASEDLKEKPEHFPAPVLRGQGSEEFHYLLQLDLPQCTGCGLCIEICPAKSKTQANHKALNRADKHPRLEQERVHLDFFNRVPAQHHQTQHRTQRGVQFLPQRFEFPGACAGCGEAGTLKLISQLFGDRMLVANATGCSSIYGGNLPTTPWTTDENGRGPAWANSLFEDNAEFGLGFRLAVDSKRRLAETYLNQLGQGSQLLTAELDTPSEIAAQRERLLELDAQLNTHPDQDTVRRFRGVMDVLVPRSVWIVGGDGWACDIGFGGVDHVLSSGRDVNLLVLDTEVYSNTGGQASKSTPLGAIAKFAASGKSTRKTDLALHGILKGNVYVGTIALGAKIPQALRTLQEAEAWPGPSLILAYSPCIAHGYPLAQSLHQQEQAVNSGHWPLLRFNPALVQQGKPGLSLDSTDTPSVSLKEFMNAELRFKLLDLTNPEKADQLLSQAESAIKDRLAFLKGLSE